MSESDIPSETSQAMILGEMRGQLREVVHSMNNLSGKFDALSREVIGLGSIAAGIVDLQTRVKVLEDSHNRHEGATGAWSTILKSPAIGWLVGAAITAWALLTKSTPN